MRKREIKTKILVLVFIAIGMSLNLLSQSGGITGDSTINRCETKPYTISLLNNSGQSLTDLVIIARLENLTGFSYVPGSTSIDINGGATFCTQDPVVSGGYAGGCAPAPGVPYLTWDIDSMCAPTTLSNGDTLNITFQLATDCTAVSGSLNTYIDYSLPGPTPMCDDTGVLNIQVNPGAVTIKKTPNVESRVVGTNVTWTLTVENTGFGVIENVEVTDVMGAGFAYVSSTQNGSNSGQTTTWTSNEYAALGSMDPGDILTMDLTATVIACDNLDNTADVRFGCDPGPTNTCFDTAVDGGTAQASVQRIVRTPLIEFTPPNITFNYCEDTQNVSFTITNIGDGIAYDVWTIIDFGSLTVTNVSAGAIYNNVDKRFELTLPLAADGDPGNSYTLSFDLNYTTWCGGSFPSGSLLWQKLYKDECDQEFYPPVELSSLNSPAGGSSVSVGKTGAPSAIQIGGQITYNITSSYSGSLSCGPGPGATSDITVVDTIPNGFTVVTPVADGGVWVDSGDGTGGTITWTYTPPASLNTTLILNLPDTSQCETYCFTTFTNNIQATGTDCCGCSLSASSSQTTAIECEELVNSEKTAVPSIGIRCNTIQYTNTYVFEDTPALDGVDLSQLVFQEDADLEQEYVSGSLAVTLSGVGDITACALSGLTDTTAGAGGNLVINFSNCSGTVRNRTLTITYFLTITENTVDSCSGATFYSWSTLDLNLTTGSECLPDGEIHETTTVSVEPPGMSLTISGLSQIVHKCESQTVTLTLTQTSGTADPKDVRLVLSGLNYYVTNPATATCGGIAPVSCTPTIDGSGDYIWEFNDAFTGSGQSATIQLDIQKRCTGSGDLVATAYFDDNCNDDGTFDDSCSVTATETPALLLGGDLLIEKTPETYYASTNSVVWEIYVTNRGTGNAYNVWVDDVLGAGLLYEHGVNPAVVDNMTGVTINDSLDHSGGAINGVSIEIASMTPGERRQLTLTAKVIDCNNLTNDVSTSWGCISVDCQTAVTDNSIVTIPAPNLINTNTITPAGGVDACSSPDGFITLRNAGQVTCYNLQVTETLPPNLLYVPGSTRWRLNTDPWNGPNAAYDPNPTTSPLVWTSAEIAQLASISPGDTIEIEFAMSADCPFTGGNITCSTQYENPCNDVFTTADSTFTAAFNAPDITITKTADKTVVGCGDTITWTIDVTNNSGYTVPIIWLEDTLGTAYTLGTIISTGDATYTGDTGTVNNRTVTWEITNLPTGTTATVTVTADTDSSPCSSDLDNTVLGWYGCGAADGFSTTKPGVDAPDNNLCLSGSSESATDTPTRRPALGFLTIVMNPSSINSCDESTQLTVTIQNAGPTAASSVDLEISMPATLSYDNTVQPTVDCGSGAGAITPSLSGPNNNILTFGLTSDDLAGKADNLCDTIAAGSSVVLIFNVRSNCFVTSNLDFDLTFYDCCDDTQYTTSSQQQLISLYPSLSITKTANISQVDCGNNVIFTVQVTNNGAGDAEVIRVVDTLGDWLDYAGSFTEDQPGTITPALIGADPQVVGWEFNDLASGATATFTFEATLNPDGLPNQNDCSFSLRQNNVAAQWGCGTTGDAVDDNPNTINYDCTDSGSAAAPVVTMEMPDLHITAVTPSIGCTLAGDGNFSGTIDVTVENQGNGDTLTGFTVSVTDGSWTGTGTTGVLNAGNSVTVSIDTSGWDPDCNSCNPYTLDATVDTVLDICECDESNNTTSTNYTAPIADLVVNSITPTCTGDGLSRVRVNIGNTGCANITSSFTVHLEDDQGNSNDIVVNSLNSGSNTNVDFNNWPTACSPATINFTATADYNDNICECDTLHSASQGYNNTSPDLVISTVTPSTTCTADGTVSGTIQVQVSNNGNGPVNADFRISVNDGQGWSSELWYQANLGGTLPLAAGTSDTVTFNWTRGFTSAPYICNFPTITLTVDSQNDICECSSGNNNTTSSYDLPFSNLRVLSITPNCTSDGSYSVDVLVGNNGCEDVNSIIVQLSDNDSQFQSQTVDITAGSQQTVTFNSWPADGNPASLVFTAAIDPGSLICELSGSDNSSNYTFDLPNLNLASLTPACLSDNNFQVSLVIQNNGAANLNTDFVVRLSDNDGNTSDLDFTAIGGSLPLNSGTQQTVVFNNWPVDCDPTTINFTAQVDFTGQVCESNTGDNSNTGNITINDLEAVSVTGSAACSTDGTVSGTIAVVVANSGGNVINSDFRVSVNDGQGWSDELWYQADLGGTLPLAVGGNDTVTFSWTRGFTSAPYVCNFPTITATVDSQSEICECTSSNNTVTSNYTLNVPDLVVNSVASTVNCISDGSLTGTTVNISNIGCVDVAGVVVRLVSDCGLTFNDISVNLAAGETRDVLFLFTSGIVDCTCDFTASIDPDFAICELDGSNNSGSSSSTMTIPDLEVLGDTLAVGCVSDGQYQAQGSITVINNGCGSNMVSDIPVRFTVFGNTNCSGRQIHQWTETLTGASIVSAGGTQEFFITNHSFNADLCQETGNCSYSVFVELDYSNQICEWDGSDNTYCSKIISDCVDLAFGDVKYDCNIDGTISMEVQITNTGRTTSPSFAFDVYNNAGTKVYSQTLNVQAGSSQLIQFNVGPFPDGLNEEFRFIVDEKNSVCECNSLNNIFLKTINCPPVDEPRLILVKSCPPAQEPGDLIQYQIEITNPSLIDLYNITIEDMIPEYFSYINGTSVLNGTSISDPLSSNPLKWAIDKIAKGEKSILTYTAVVDSDTDPGRYCNNVTVTGSTALSEQPLDFGQVQCCTVIRQGIEGCCLRIDEFPQGFIKIPEVPVSYIDPYFITEQAMLTSLISFDLWQKKSGTAEGLDLFVLNRVKNYALANLEEFYLKSGKGITDPEGNLRLSYAGAIPEGGEQGWITAYEDKNMYLSQVGFEILALSMGTEFETNLLHRAAYQKMVNSRIDFLADQIVKLPHKWLLDQDGIISGDDKAEIYDKSVIFYSLARMVKKGNQKAKTIVIQVLDDLKLLQNSRFDKKLVREELFYILGQIESGQKTKINRKITDFENQFKNKELNLDNLFEYGLALYTDYMAGGSIVLELASEMKNRFFSQELGIFSHYQSDFTYKFGLPELAGVMLALQAPIPQDWGEDFFSRILYRSVEETGIFLNKRNLLLGKPPLNLLKNYPFKEQMLPMISFIQGEKNIKPVYTKQAVVYSSHTKPTGAHVFPYSFSKIFSPEFETSTGKISTLSWVFDYFGKLLMENGSSTVIKEKGRALNEAGRKYLATLMKSGSGLEIENKLVVPFERIVIKRIKDSVAYNLEPIQPGQFSTSTMADFILAQAVNGSQQEKGAGRSLLPHQYQILAEFEQQGYVPKTFSLTANPAKDFLNVQCSAERASKITVAKLYSVFKLKFLREQMAREITKLEPQDIIFFLVAPETTKYFQTDIKRFIELNQPKVGATSARIIARKFTEIDFKQELLKLDSRWIEDIQMPETDFVDVESLGEIYQYSQLDLILFLLAKSNEADSFSFMRTLSLLTYLTESEWGTGIQTENQILPAQSYWLFREIPAPYPEPGDVLTLKVRVQNQCLEPFMIAKDFANLLIKADFSPSLVYQATFKDANISYLGNLTWKYQGVPSGKIFDFIYQVYIPESFRDKVLTGWIRARGFTQSVAGTMEIGDSEEFCEDIYEVHHGQIMRPEYTDGLVFKDHNFNGRKDPGEEGISGILIKDTNGLIYRSDAQGKFKIRVRRSNTGVQVSLNSVPLNYVFSTSPTKIVNRFYKQQVVFGLVPCITISGVVFNDSNKNGIKDEEESTVSGVELNLKEKRVFSDTNGMFNFKNVPLIWENEITIKEDGYLNKLYPILKFMLIKK